MTRVMLWVIIVLALIGFLYEGADAAEDTMRRDTDGWVREYTKCDGNDWQMGATTQVQVYKGGYYDFPAGYYYNIDTDRRYYFPAQRDYLPAGVETTIRYDTCEMNYRGAGSEDWRSLYAHERAHARGWDHYEAPESLNAAYDPIVKIYKY